MQKTGFEIAKKIIVGLVILATFGALLAPFSQTLAQQNVQDPGTSPPLDSDPTGCITVEIQELAAPYMSAPGPLLTKDVAAIFNRFQECVLRRTEKQKDWWYRRGLYLKNQWGMRLLTSVYGGLVDAMSMIAQRIAYEAASDLLTGNPGNEPRFWNSSFDTWLENAGMDASSKFLDRLDVVVGDWTQSTTATYDPKTNQVIPGFRFSFCKPPDPYTLRLSLGIGEVARLGPGACNLKKVADNFKAIGDLVSSGDAIQLHRPSVQYGASDLSVGVETNSTYFNYLINKRAGLSLNRQEDHGMRPVMDVVSGKIKIPTVLMEQSYKDLSPTAMAKSSEAEQRGAILSAYFQVGLENIPILALTTFTNTLIVGLLHKWLDPKGGAITGEGALATPGEVTVKFDALKNADATGDAQDLFERQEFAKALGDYLIPNFSSTEDRDIIIELTTCNTPRKRFNCAMDQALGVAIQVGTREGALTVGRASGIGTQGSTFSPATQALHDEWEMIPESDMKNNTDPTCAQRAYCAGNLKKMRLARIITVGWEMAANSPYNLKRNGKYITLGEVIRGFYDCNEQGKLDKDHPWCHLIDPNWILTAPKYQCRAKGFGDAILPGVGTRLDECGDMVSCLKTNQNNECIGGFGYCLAERPVWRFDAQECASQYVSCRTYNYVGGQVSLLRNTTDKGNCSEENMGCTWYATARYVTSTASPDNLWVSSVTSGPRVYFDRGALPCSSEGCTKVFRATPGQGALNLVQNGSFENLVTATINNETVIQGINGWRTGSNCTVEKAVLNDAFDGTYSVSLNGQNCEPIGQNITLYPGRYYVLSYYLKSQAKAGKDVTSVKFYKRQPDGSSQPINDNVTTYGDCSASGGDLTFNKGATDSWQRISCEFVSPKDVAYMTLKLSGTPGVSFYDGVQLEESEVVTPFIDGVAQGLATAYLKIAPDEYKCTGDDTKDHPGCKRFARVCRQTDVGCQGYKDVEDVTAPEIPANLTAKDLCPAICAGYGEYRKLPSTFDLVKDPSHPPFDDPEDETVSYFIPGSLTESCSLEDVGCEPFTSMEAATSTGEKVAYYKDIRLCQKPNDQAATYFTWEGSDVTGYQIRTWSLIASDLAHVTSSSPKLVLRGGALGQIKDPATCNDITWKLGNDPDCRQFYDVGGHVYYNFYSQTVSSDPTCTTYRKDDSTESDCAKTGGDFVTASKSCTYQALPSESLSCPAVAGGCRAYLGPTGRNAINVFRDTFATGTQIIFDKSQGGNTTLQYSNESVLVGDRSLKLEAPQGSPIDATLKLAINSTSTLMRVSFWAKANRPRGQNDQPSKVMIDGVEVGTFYPDAIWSRFEVGPFTAKQNPTVIEIVVPSQSQTQNNIVYVDTFSVDQLNDVQFVRKNHWAIPLACDSTPEGTPEPRYMVGCREYNSRNGDTVFVRNFSRLCRDTAIGCSAFIDTNDKPQPYSETKTVKGTNYPADFYLNSYAKHGAAKAYEEQFFGDWSITSRPYRYYYAIDDDRGRCDSTQASCRGYGKPIFRQDRIGLATTTYQVDPANADIYSTQKALYGFNTVLFKDDWNKYLKDNGDPNMACRKDELFCDQFKSGNVTEYFRDPGKQACVWRKVKKLQKNDQYNIPSDGEYSGWFREGTDIPCYPPYLVSGNNYLIQYTGEADFAGWGGKCPVDQSECTEFVDPNDTSDPSHPQGRSYNIINGPKVDKSTCGGTADPLSGCVLFRDKGVGALEANSQATYAKVMAEKGAAQSPVDCQGDPGNQYCKQVKAGSCESLNANINGKQCSSDADCQPGTCRFNDSNVVIKVKMDRECARWMGCSSGETVFDTAQQKFVTQCSNWQLCQQNGSTNEDVYCQGFTDRSKEDYLKSGQFVTPESYSARSIGFGKLDYSGYTMANRYLLPDMETDAFGFDLLTGVNDTMAQKYQHGRNLVAFVPKGKTTIIGSNRCQDPQTKRTGLLKGDFCLLPISETYQPSQVSGGATFDASFDADQIAKELARGVNPDNANLQQALPTPECQLYPEEGSPLPTLYVQEWNVNTNPPTPKKMIDGYEQAKTCVFGEDCSCSYRKVRYGNGTELYYSIEGSPPMIGICRGGERDGQPCSNRAFTPVVQGGKLLYSKTVLGDYQPCGASGICEEIQDVVFVKGKYAYCLERDLTRASDAPQKIAPCLTWAPIALQGKLDSYHYAPTSDYMPLQGRGEYYCVSGTQGQSVEKFNHSTTKVDPALGVNYGNDFYAPGKTKDMACNYQYVMNQPDQTKVISYLNGGTNGGYSPDNDNFKAAQASDLQHACRRAEVCQGKAKAPVCANDEGLWIQAGPKHETTYSEYFVLYKPGLQQVRDEKYFDYHYGMFRFFPVKAPDGAVCKWHPAWVNDSLPPIASDNFSCSDYLSQVQAKSDSVYQNLTNSFKGILDRRNESILRDSSLTPLRLRCVLGDKQGSGCYYKYWEVDYNTQASDNMFSYPKDNYEKQVIKGQDISGDMNFFNPSTVNRGPNGGRCESDHAYFGIRAMFQNVNDLENTMSSDIVQSRKLQGPWQFVGFWITACAPYQFSGGGGSYTSSDNFLMYLKLQAVKVDACRTVAEVIEPNTRESAGFADRLWASGKFIVPYIGAKYSRFNEPFGSAIASTKIGSDPMVIGDSIPPSSDPSTTPTFPDAGLGLAADFVGTDMDPWFSLTNLFARIYAVYRWEVNQVYINTPICTDYPGKAGTENQTRPTCTTITGELTGSDQIIQNLKDCSGWSAATEVTDQKDLDKLWSCNALSGVNRGMSCGQDPNSSSKNSDPKCHNAPYMYWKYEEKSGLSYTLEDPLYGSCQRQTSGGNPVLRIPRLKLSANGKGFALKKQNQGSCKLLGATDRLLVTDGQYDAKSLVDIAGSGKTKFMMAGVYPYYQEVLLTPDNMEELVYKIISQGMTFRNQVYDWAYASCNAMPPILGIFTGDDIKDQVLYNPTKPLLLNVQNVAGLVVKYLDAAKGENVPVQNYAARLNTTSKIQPSPDNVYIDNKSFDAMVAKLLAMQIGGNAAVNGNEVESYRTMFTALANMGYLTSQYDGSVLVPTYVNLNPFDYDFITGKTILNVDASIYTCGADSVEPGKLCMPDKTKSLSQANDKYLSSDCPKKIVAANFTKINGKADLDKVFDYLKDYEFSKTDQGGSYVRKFSAVNVPKVGFCFKGLGSGEGQANYPNPTDFYNDIYHTNSQSASLGETYLYDTAKSALNDNTGFCMGFNTFSRCRTNADCTFSTNQWWGMHDDGGGANSNFYGKLQGLIIFPSSQAMASDAVGTIYKDREVRLPTPYKQNPWPTDPDGIQSKYEMQNDGSPIFTNLLLLGNESPLKIDGDFNSIGHFDVYGGSGKERYVFMRYLNFVDSVPDTYGIKKDIKDIYNFYRAMIDNNLFYQYLPGAWNGWFGGGLNQCNFDSDDKFKCATYMLTMTADLLHESLVFVIQNAYFQFPNQYAREFGTTVDLAYANNNDPAHTDYERTVTSAPFVVDFWHRLIGSLGYSGRTHLYQNDNDSKEGIYNMWGEDDAFNNNWDTLWSTLAFFNRGNFIRGNIAINEPGKNYLVGSLGPIGTSDLKGPWPINDRFFWEKLFFTDLFPLLTKNTCYQSGVHSSAFQINLLRDIDDYGTMSDAEKLSAFPSGGLLWTVPHIELFDLCDYFGYGAKFRNNMIAWRNDRDDINMSGGGTGPGFTKIASDNIGFYDAKNNNMRRDYFDQTAWGLVMKPDHPDFNLYPGIVPSSVYKPDEKYNIYLPAHCEPAVNTIDPTSNFSGYAVKNNVPVSASLPQNYDDRKASDSMWLGPKIDNSATGWAAASNILVSHLFINPWQDVTGLNIDKYDAQKGMTFASEDDMGIFQATVDLSGESNPITADDFRGKLNNGQLAGAMRTAYICERTGQEVLTIEECNKDLIDKGWDISKYEKMTSQQLFDPKTTVGSGTPLVNLCNTPDKIDECKQDSQGKSLVGTFLPPDYTEECSTDPAAAPDKDCNSCTHSPGFKPLVNKLTAYELGNPESTNYNPGGGTLQFKKYPSATDLTSGLDTFNYMAKYSNTYGKAELVAPYQPLPPKTAAPDASKVGTTANAKPVLYINPFSVNNNPEGIVYLGSDQGVATIRFYAWAAHDQGPIKDITIDWGDGETTHVEEAKIKNNKPICNTDMECANIPGLACTGDGDCPPGGGSCMQTGRCESSDKLCYKSVGQPGNCGGTYQCLTRVLFGNSPEDCRQGYFEFTHVYKPGVKSMVACGPAKRCMNEPDLLDGNCRDGEPGVARRAPRTGCYDSVLKMVRFTPRIMVKDNWGWCTGDCSQPNEPTPDNYYTNPNRYPIRHPNKGCWDGSATRYNTAPGALVSPFGDECAETNKKGRPWEVFQGSIELSVTEQATLNLCKQKCQNDYDACLAQNQPNCGINVSLCNQGCSSKIQ